MDAKEYVCNCALCQKWKPIPHATLFQISLTPFNGSNYIVDYLKHGHTDKKFTRHRRRDIEFEADSYQLIEGQPYYHGKRMII